MKLVLPQHVNKTIHPVNLNSDTMSNNTATATLYQNRRLHLLGQLQKPLLLFSGAEVPRNAPSVAYPFRADSNFLYLFGPCEPGCAAFLDPDNAQTRFFAPQRSPQNTLWTGPQPSFETLKHLLGVDEVLEVEGLEEYIGRLGGGRPLLSLAVADERSTQRAQKLTGLELSFGKPGQLGPHELLRALALMRLCKGPEEIEAIGYAAQVTYEAHLQAMRHTRPGLWEYEIYAHLLATFAKHHCQEAYATLTSIRGEVLHNPHKTNRMQEGDLLLVDAGAEGPSGYGADVTRTLPVGGKFGAQAKAIYEVVLSANQRCIEAICPGIRFHHLQQVASKTLAEGLLGVGLLKGPLEDILASGALSVFFPHGIGHLLGLDVHDLGGFEAVLVEPPPPPAPQAKTPGQPQLRMDVVLKEGMVFTVEPGIYFIPSRIYSPEFRKAFSEFVNFEAAEHYVQMAGGRGFGGIRIEDNVVCTATQAHTLTSKIPKQLEEVEALVGTAP